MARAALASIAVLVAARPAHAGGPSNEDPCPVRAVFTAGGSTASLLGVGSAAGRLGVGLLWTHDDDDAGVIGGLFIDGDLGSTFGGLPIKTLTLSAPILFVSGPFRIGAGPEVTYVRLTRSDRTLESIDGVGIGLAGFVGLDLLRAKRDRSIFLALRPQVAWLHNARDPIKLDHYAISPGIAFVVGARF